VVLSDILSAVMKTVRFNLSSLPFPVLLWRPVLHISLGHVEVHWPPSIKVWSRKYVFAQVECA
jgi:hypothetical protein